MEASRQTRVLAVGLDSAEPTLVRKLIDRGELPTLAGLLENGHWALVDARGDVASGAVWPTFFTGTEPDQHQTNSGWRWRPKKMDCSDPGEGAEMTPFWKPLVDRGGSVGVLDVAFAPMTGAARGFEVSELGPHEVVHGTMRSSPSRAAEIVARSPRHPFYEGPYGPGAADDRDGKQRLSSACVAGARVRGAVAAELIAETRPELAIVVFPEIHHATHQFWHMIEPDHELYADVDLRDQLDLKPDLVDIYREVDRQLGRIIDAAGSDTLVMAFSLHGMQPGVGIPVVHERLLEALGFSPQGAWRGLSWRDRAMALFGNAKRHAPESLRSLYKRATGPHTRNRLAQPTVVLPRDWSRTRAFSLPTDQRAYIRVNLAGREAKGIVPERDYRATCDEVEEALRGARTVEGESLVDHVMRPAEEVGGPPEHLPDLVVTWGDAAFASPARVLAGSIEFESYPVRRDMTGQHANHGFCILDERLSEGPVGELIAGKDLHRSLLAALDASPADSTA